jgi:hypothetical protein
MTTASEEVLLGTNTWVLRVISWQQSIHGVNKSHSGEYIGEHRLDLKCRMERGLLQGDLLVGEDPTENLANLDFAIQLRGAQKIFSTFGKDATEDDENATGALLYYPPIPPPESLAGLPSRHIEESKTGSVTGSVWFDDPALWEIARSLPALSDREVYLSVTIRAAATPKPGLLVYERQEYGPTTYRWSGQYGLIVRGVSLINRAAKKPELEIPAEPEQTRDIEISTAIHRATETLNKTIVRMGIYLLIVLVAILFQLYLH